ncbi:protein RRP6-like 2 [Phalaenopsis equestris]|uniref:protein RRP6-like 2 n=1 Tax=Phalaenopsis equestris TaxID=78828 RepID=UPI0009E3914D|nr:protein RRP6-like 2 [Phalaenopsis equestris]
METEIPSSESVEQKAEALASLISGPLSSSASRLLSRSRNIPYGKDFHFYNNFDEFKLPARGIASTAESSLGVIASSLSLWGDRKSPPIPNELDEAYEWLVNLNDDFLERFGVAMDDFRSLREKQERKVGAVDSGDGFQLVCGRKKKREVVQKQEGELGFSASSEIKMVSRDKKTTAARAKVPFHLPNIPKPQLEFKILVNNNNTPFEHVWLERSEDDSRFMHPLEKLSVLDFIDKDIGSDEITKPLSLESTPFKLIEGVKELKELAAKLRVANEFAVDLEHNQYRSFLGLTCLMQISTRTEDFIVDTLKLRVHVGPYLREVFKDPLKRKVMHGADRDIIWLQRDFGIYVCNLFDTGQASRLLQLERNSLEYLLRHFCDVEANKEYQNADWRLRPLPDEMIKYAREDTHYLLHIYDLMRSRLLSLSSDENDLLLEVYKRSSEICIQLYEKEVLTDTSYLHIYGLSEADFDAKQLAIVAGLCEWRDKVAREEDESTGYILPNKAVLEIARQMPQSSGSLRRLVKSKHHYVERHLNAVLRIIKNAISNSSAFESIAEEIRKGRAEALAMQISEAENSESVNPNEHAMDCTAAEGVGKSSNKLDILSGADNINPTSMNQSLGQITSVSRLQGEKKIPELSLLEISYSSKNVDAVETVKRDMIDNEAASSSQPTKDGTPTASVQVMKKPACAFGALFGNTSRKKTKPLKGNDSELEKNEKKVEQIKASVILPFYSFPSKETIPEPTPTDKNIAPTQTVQSPDQHSLTATLEEVIPLENSMDSSESPPKSPENVDVINSNAEISKADAHATEPLMSLSDLHSGFQQMSQHAHEKSGLRGNSWSSSQISPFDYAAARRSMKFGEENGGEDDGSTSDGVLMASRSAKKKVFPSSGEQREGGGQPRRRQAFPPSGNRSTTYRC